MIRRLVYLSMIAIVVAISASPAFACEPVVPTICQAYSRADAVFIGTLIMIEKVEPSSFGEIDAHFVVKRTFKGHTDAIEIIRFRQTDCEPNISDIGEAYFVYKNPRQRRMSQIADRTARVVDSLAQVKYAESLTDKDPIYNIGGLITGLGQDELAKVVVTIGFGQNRESVGLDKHGFFDLTVRKPGDYTVRLTLPFKAQFREKVLAHYKQSEGTSIEYTLSFAPNECDYREIEIERPEQ